MADFDATAPIDAVNPTPQLSNLNNDAVITPEMLAPYETDALLSQAIHARSKNKSKLALSLYEAVFHRGDNNALLFPIAEIYAQHHAQLSHEAPLEHARNLYLAIILNRKQLGFDDAEIIIAYAALSKLILAHPELETTDDLRSQLKEIAAGLGVEYPLQSKTQAEVETPQEISPLDAINFDTLATDIRNHTAEATTDGASAAEKPVAQAVLGDVTLKFYNSSHIDNDKIYYVSFAAQDFSVGYALSVTDFERYITSAQSILRTTENLDALQQALATKPDADYALFTPDTAVWRDVTTDQVIYGAHDGERLGTATFSGGALYFKADVGSAPASINLPSILHIPEHLMQYTPPLVGQPTLTDVIDLTGYSPENFGSLQQRLDDPPQTGKAVARYIGANGVTLELSSVDQALPHDGTRSADRPYAAMFHYSDTNLTVFLTPEQLRKRLIMASIKIPMAAPISYAGFKDDSLIRFQSASSIDATPQFVSNVALDSLPAELQILIPATVESRSAEASIINTTADSARKQRQSLLSRFWAAARGVGRSIVPAQTTPPAEKSSLFRAAPDVVAAEGAPDSGVEAPVATEDADSAPPISSVAPPAAKKATRRGVFLALGITAAALGTAALGVAADRAGAFDSLLGARSNAKSVAPLVPGDNETADQFSARLKTALSASNTVKFLEGSVVLEMRRIKDSYSLVDMATGTVLGSGGAALVEHTAGFTLQKYGQGTGANADKRIHFLSRYALELNNGATDVGIIDVKQFWQDRYGQPKLAPKRTAFKLPSAYKTSDFV